MSTQRGKLIPFWRNVATHTVETYMEDEPSEKPPNLEQLAKNIELARAHKIECDGEAIKAEGLLNRCIDAYEEEVKRRGLLSRK